MNDIRVSPSVIKNSWVIKVNKLLQIEIDKYTTV